MAQKRPRPRPGEPRAAAEEKTPDGADNNEFRTFPQLMPPPRARRGWLRAAENVELRTMAGQLTVDDGGGFTALIVTLGPRFYVRSVADRLARQRGFVVTSVRRDDPDLVNPLTGEPNRVYVVRLERRQ